MSIRVLNAIALTLIVVFGVNYIYGAVGGDCRLPVYYTIGDFDERFGIGKDEAVAALRAAEEVWEKDLGRYDIFEYRDNAPLKVNFVYDERQRQAEAAAGAKNELETRGEANEVLVELHRKLVAEYKAKEADYDRARVAYEGKLDAYNDEVEKYNREGGAPEEVYRELERRRQALDVERREINAMGEDLNSLSDRINEIGDKGNELIGEYNRKVRQFNDTFVHDHEFTQGDYRGRQINIYTWNGFDELILVLVHEFGHSLAIGHVDDPTAVMHYLMGQQPIPATLTESDKAEFRLACEQGTTNRLLAPLRSLYNSVIN